ncbi:MAG: FIST signal transduction protein [Candidatus Omnitrophota bacterium]
MATFIGLGFSEDKDPYIAAREACLLAKSRIKPERLDLTLVFSTVNYSNSEIIRGVFEVAAAPPLIGTSSAALILPQGIKRNGVAVLAVHSDEIRLGLGASEDIASQQERLHGNELAQGVVKNFGLHKRHLFMMLCDGLIENNSELIRGAQEVLGKSFPFMGGASSDDLSFSATFQYFNNRLLTKSAVGIMWGGEMTFGLGIKHGWRPLGKPRIATEVSGNILRTIDQQPAVRLYEDYFGREIQELYDSRLGHLAILYPIGIYAKGEEEYLLRNAIGLTREGHIVCQGEVPQGAEIRLMIGSKESCLNATKEAALEAKAGLSGKEAALVLIFDSISRRKLLGRDSDKEIAIVREVFGEYTPFAGFYTFGEIAPLKALDYQGQTYFHNETVAILALAV